MPPHLANLHNVFYVSQIWKYIADPTHVLETNDVQFKDDLTLDVRLVRIVDSQVKKLRRKEIQTVKVLWDEAMCNVLAKNYLFKIKVWRIY